MSMKKVKAKSLHRADSSHPDDLSVIPKCTGIKYIGDPVEAIWFKQGEYNANLKRLVSLELKNHPDHVDTADALPTTKENDNSRLGFNLMSLTSRRGHFVHEVTNRSKAEVAGLKQGDLVMEVNGNLIRDLTHEEVVKMIRQSSVEDDVLHLTIVSKDQEVVV